MKRTAVFLCVCCALFLGACTGTQVSRTMPDEPKSSASSASSKADSYLEVARPTYQAMTEGWYVVKEQVDPLSSAEFKTDLAVFVVSCKNGKILLNDKDSVDDKNAYWVEAGNKNSVFCAFYSKFSDTVLRVYPVTDKDGGPFFPNGSELPKKGAMVYEKTDMNGLATLWIPYLQEKASDGYDQYGCAYVVEVSWDDGFASYYPAAPMMSATEDSSKILNVSALDDGSIPVEPVPEEKVPVQVPRVEQEPDKPSIVFPSEVAYSVQLDPTESTLIANLNKKKTEALLKEYTAKAGAAAGSAVEKAKERVFIDSFGRRFLSRRVREGHMVILFDIESDTYTLLESLDVLYNAFADVQTDFYALPEGSYYIQVNSTRYGNAGSYAEYDCRLVCADIERIGFPIKEDLGPIRWLFSQAPDPSNPAKSMLFGILGEFNYLYPNAVRENPYLVLQQNETRFTRWFTSGKIHGNDSYYFPSIIISIVAGNNDFAPPYEFTASFEENGDQVEVRFPSSCTSFRFDFNKFTITYAVHYTPEFLEQESSIYVCSSADERFEIWKVNLRHQYEGSMYSYGLYDTQEKTFQDFGLLNSYVQLSFVDSSRLALLGLDQQNITLYHLETGEMESLYLNTGDLGSTHYFWSLLWDEGTQQYVLVSMPMNIYDKPDKSTLFAKDKKNFEDHSGGYYFSYFSPDGDYLGSHRTDIQQYGERFAYYPTQAVLLEDGTIFLYSPLDDDTVDRQIILNTKTGEVRPNVSLKEVLPNVYMKRETAVIDEILEFGSSRDLQYRVDRWVEEPQCVEAFRYLMSQTGLINEEITNQAFFSPNEKMAFLPHNAYFLEGGGQSPEKIVVYEVPEFYSSLAPIPWNTSDGAQFFFMPDINESRYRFFLVRLDKENAAFHLVPDTAISSVVPSSVSTFFGNSSSPYFHISPFFDYRFEPHGDTAQLYSKNKTTGKEELFLQVVYSDGHFRLLR